MNTTELGTNAEDAVCDFLQRNGFRLIDKNWKTPTCEIDVIAFSKGTIYFVEVKFRSGSSNGNGFEYITPAKIKRMIYSARLWSAQNKWSGQVVLSGASVSGSDLKIDFIENIGG